MVVAVDQQLLFICASGEKGVWLYVNGMRGISMLRTSVADSLAAGRDRPQFRDILIETPSKCHVQKLHSPADAENGQVAPERRL